MEILFSGLNSFQISDGIDVGLDAFKYDGEWEFRLWASDITMRKVEDAAKAFMIDDGYLRECMRLSDLISEASRSYEKEYSEGTECETCGWNADDISATFVPPVIINGKNIPGEVVVDRSLGCYSGYGESFAPENTPEIMIDDLEDDPDLRAFIEYTESAPAVNVDSPLLENWATNIGIGY